MKPRFMLNSVGCALMVIVILGGLPALVSPVHADASDKGRRNVLFITCDQRMFQPVRAKGFRQPALDRLAARGVTFTNHYISSAVCTPSRGVIYSGLAPQVMGIQEEMMFGWTPSLPTNAVSMGTAMKRLGYATAYFGKFELDRDIVFPKPGVNYADALKGYGFDVWQPYGEVTGEQNQGYEVDGVIGAEGIRWLRTNAERLRKAGEPWFLVLSFINPHDIFFADVNPPGTSVQKGLKPGQISAIPADAQYRMQWDFPMWRTLDEPLRAPGPTRCAPRAACAATGPDREPNASPDARQSAILA